MKSVLQTPFIQSAIKVHRTFPSCCSLALNHFREVECSTQKLITYTNTWGNISVTDWPYVEDLQIWNMFIDPDPHTEYHESTQGNLWTFNVCKPVYSLDILLLYFWNLFRFLDFQYLSLLSPSSLTLCYLKANFLALPFS